MHLRSQSVGNVLYNFLWIDLGLTVLLLINTVITWVVGTGETFLNYDATISFVWLFINLIYGILFLSWIFKVHRDLQEREYSYPIKPGGALARILIPFYNIYGLWNVYATMAHYLQEHTSKGDAGNKLAVYVPLFYIILWVSAFMNYIVTDVFIHDTFNIWWFITYIGDAALTLMYILMVQVITAGLGTLSVKDPNE